MFNIFKNKLWNFKNQLKIIKNQVFNVKIIKKKEVMKNGEKNWGFRSVENY